jgi:trehalose 6-phosphate synthase
VNQADLLVVSNRGPLSFRFDEQGRPVSAGSGGGLAGTLHDIFEGSGATWVACAMNGPDRAAAADGLMKEKGLRLVTVEPDEERYQLAYNVVSNSILWFAHHHLFDAPRRPRIDSHFADAWNAYRDVNMCVAEAVCDAAANGAVVLVQDYHLVLVPEMVARLRPDLAVVHFSHTPFADPNVLRILPTTAMRELLEGMAGATACGFHSPRWEASFLACCTDAGVEPPNTFVSPLGPDPVQLAERVSAPGVSEARERLNAIVGNRRAIVKVDRVEPSKNLLRGFWALDELLRTRPQWREKVVLLALFYSSRQDLPEYLEYGNEVELAAGELNDAWATDDWTPVVLEIADDHDRALAGLTLYDVLLVNPLRDGMNLVAKEGPIVNVKNGALALSTQAGAYDELAAAAFGLNPFDVTETASALAAGLEISADRRSVLAGELRRLATGRTPADWLEDQLKAAALSTAR